MKERPILFSAAMVRALLNRTKTQTRRVVKPQPELREIAQVGHMLGFKKRGADGHWLWPNAKGRILGECPYGAPGDRLWVREAFRFPESLDHLSPSAVGEKALAVGYPKPWCPTHFESDGSRRTAAEWRSFVTPDTPNEPGKLRPPMFMPRWASRITLEITGVRVERLQDISEADARAEGIEWLDHPPVCAANAPAQGWRGYMKHEPLYRDSARESFASLWRSINGTASWDANPWVWVVEFRRLP